MKKIVLFAVMLCMLLSLFACADKENESPEITFAEVYDAACTQPLEAETVVNSDLTLYVKWGE